MDGGWIYVVEAFSSVDDATRATGLWGSHYRHVHTADQKELFSGLYIPLEEIVP